VTDPQQIADALKRWQARYPDSTIRDLGWALMDIATASHRASIQAGQAIARPNHTREAAEAVRAYERLRECVSRFNSELAQLRDGRWPD
jgi:hypothetical protein